MTLNGGWSQLWSSCHETEKASSASAPGDANRELNRGSRRLSLSAKRSMSCLPKSVDAGERVVRQAVVASIPRLAVVVRFLVLFPRNPVHAVLEVGLRGRLFDP
mmetsp:Transcript_18652/g.60280  ORF Transcript_18652/g.60280 Transcript_18652/m.60280 type:complete len:104 (+) Transcript_18652:1081-1392(+)